MQGQEKIWCVTLNPVCESKFLEKRRVLSAGGKGHNVARQLRCWGVPAISLVPKTGARWLQLARGERIPVRLIPVRCEARMGWALLKAPGSRRDFFTEDPRWQSVDWARCGGFLHRVARPGDWLVVAGSVPKGARRGWWKSLFLRLKNRNVRILVDGKGQILREALQAGVDWAKANLAEAEETLHQKGSSRCLTGMRKIARGRCGLLITLGSRGLLLEQGKTRLAVAAPKIRLRDATGSGDVVTAALIYGIRKGWEIGKVAGFAVWTGSENAARRDEVAARLKGRGVFA